MPDVLDETIAESLHSGSSRAYSACLGSACSMMVYRQSMLKAAGYDSFPKDTTQFLAMMKALHADRKSVV